MTRPSLGLLASGVAFLVTARGIILSGMLPTRWNWFVNGFRRYVRRYVRKHFHAVRVSNTSHPLPAGDSPLLFVLNHPSWWDPMIGTVLADLFPTYTHYAAIDAAIRARVAKQAPRTSRFAAL